MIRTLVGKCFGLGNAVMSVPLIKALGTLGPVDVLCGMGSDDAGALDVFLAMQREGMISELHLINAMSRSYDVAVMAIPFDGRWQAGTHFQAERILDGRPRPENCPELGFAAWRKHEVEYQMEDARELGFSDGIPSMAFLPVRMQANFDSELVYLGLGFKRDAANFWSAKHWGNDRYVRFIRRCRELRPTIRFRATGNAADLAQTIIPIAREVGEMGPPVSHIGTAFAEVARCGSYFGNDTGMMHVAASLDRPTFGLIAYENVATKNRPWCSRWRTHEFFRGGSDPETVAAEFIDFVWGSP